MNETEGAAAIYFNQQVAKLFRANRQKALDGREGMDLTAFPLRMNGGHVVVDNGNKMRSKLAYFEEPFLETSRFGFLFDTYKGRWARHVTSLVTKLAQELRFFKATATPGLYRCPGTPGLVSSPYS